MKNRIVSILAASAVASSLIAGAVPVTAMADGTMVVSIGADLTDDQVTAILKYFGIYGNNNVQRITVTNQDERNHLASSIPIEQIGTRTISCALVKPTVSGGVQVKTANLDYVTSNMIASNLVTCGVTNCEAIAAAPFVVSGTGALTGVLMAYQNATGTQISQDALDLSAQEISLTEEISNSAENQQVAQQIVNDVKLQVIDGTVDTVDNSQSTDNSVITDNSVDNSQVSNIVNNVVNNYTTNNNGIQLTEQDIQNLTDYAVKLAQQSYEAGTESAQQQVQALAPIQQELSEQSGVPSSDTSTTIVNNVTVNTDSTASADGGSADASSEGGDTTSSDSILNNTNVGELATLNGGDTSSVPVTGTDESATQADLANGATDQDAVIAETVQESETAAADPSGLQIQITDSNAQDQTSVQTDAADGTAAQTDAQTGEAVLPADDGTTAETAAQTDAEGNAVLPADDASAAEGQAVTEVPAAAVVTADQTDSYSASYLTDDGMASVPAFTLALRADNLIPVSGTFTVSDESGNVLGTADLADSSSVTAVTSGTVNDEFKNDNMWDQLTGLFFQPKDQNGSAVVPQAGMTYTVTLNGTFAQTADPAQVQTAPTVSYDLENITFTAPAYAGAGFNLDGTALGDIKAGGTLTTALTDDGTFASATLSNPDGTASLQAADGSQTVYAGGDMTVYVTLQNAPGLVEADIAYSQGMETEFDMDGNVVAAAGGEGTTLRYFIPVQAAQ